MKKVVYTLEQMQQLAGYLNALVVSGIDNCRLITLSTNIIDNPIETIEEEKEGEKDEP